MERGIPPKERLRQQDLYSERMATGEKALVMKQTMTVKGCLCTTSTSIILSMTKTVSLLNFKEEKLEEIKDIIEMKVTHRRNIKRRLEKFGYESNSTIGLDLAGAANVIAPDAGEDDLGDMDMTILGGAAAGTEGQQ